MGKKRLIQYDVIRVMAMLFVICVHVKLKPFASHRYISSGLYAVFFTCNGLFFMLSGKFNLSKKFDDVSKMKQFYIKNFKKIVIPFIVATLFLALGNMIQNHMTISIFDYFRYYKHYMADVAPYSILWFMYPLFGMLISAPFLAKMLQNMDEKQLKLLMIISLIWVFITENLGMYGYATHMRNFFITSTLVYFIGGYCLDHITYKKLKPVHVILIGLVGLLVTIYIRVKYQFKSAYDISLYYILFTFAVYWLGERFFDIKNHIVISIVETLAKYSFYVYMFHYIILNNVEGHFMTLSPSIHMLIVVILTLALSLAWAMVFNVLIKLLEKFIYKLPLLKNS